MNDNKFWVPLLLGISWFAASAFLFVFLFPYQATADWFRTAGFFMGGVGVAPLGLLLAHRRTVSLSDQTENEIARRATDSYTKAVELLGHAEIAVRQGGIYALGRIAAENPEEHPKIMSIITAYIRHRSRAYVYNEYEKEKKAQSERNAEFNKDRATWMNVGMGRHPHQSLVEFIENNISRYPSPIDLEAAVAVICGRNSEFDIPLVNGTSLNLSGAFLFRINFGGASLEQVDFTGSVLRDCLFGDAKLNHAAMEGADFTNSSFHETDMSDVHAVGAIFSSIAMDDVIMRGADLTEANFQEADLWCVDFSKVGLSGASFQRAGLFCVNFDDADLGEMKFADAFADANVEETEFDNANVCAADLRGVQPFTEEQIREAKGNWNTKLPAGWAWPEHWPKHDPDKKTILIE